MGLIRSDDTDELDEERQKRAEVQQETQRKGTADQAAVRQAIDNTETIQANPQFLEQLRDTEIDAGGFALEDELAAETSGAHVIGNREPDLPKKLDLLNANKADRVIAERDPSPIYKEKLHLLKIAQDAHKNSDRTVSDPITSEERRAVRSAFDALTAYQSLAAQNRGLRSITEATAVTRDESGEQEESWSRRMGEALR